MERNKFTETNYVWSNLLSRFLTCETGHHRRIILIIISFSHMETDWCIELAQFSFTSIAAAHSVREKSTIVLK